KVWSPYNSIFGHAVINFICPRGDAPFDALEVLEALLAQELKGAKRAYAALAVNVILLIRVQFCETLRQRAQGQERHAIHMRDLVFIGLADVDDSNAQLRIS